jgi:geranylgeranyl pyrophosphate synthase
VVMADSLEAALEAAIRRFDGTSPVTPQVHHHVGHAAGNPGLHERLRMQLVLEVVSEEGGRTEDGIDVACAVEILHNSTLVHDTVEDDARSLFGLAHGINAGDALCALAYLQLLEGPPRRTPEQTVLMTRALQEANFALCAGQAQELVLARNGAAEPGAYVAMIAGKAALFAVACELGALVAGASPERTHAYARLGRASGMATLVPPLDAREYLRQADAIASEAGIDAGGRVRAFFARALSPAHE